MSIYRSEDVIRCQLFLPTDALYQSVANLGEIEAVQFLDLNDNVHQFKKMFTNEIRRVDELQRKLRFFEHMLKEFEKEIPETDDYPLAPAPKELPELETAIDLHANELKELSSNLATLERHHAGTLELRSVLEKTEEFFLEVGQNRSLSIGRTSVVEEMKKSSHETPLPPTRGSHRGHMWYSTGVLPFRKMTGFYKTVWLSSHGNTILHFMDEPLLTSVKKAGSAHMKSVFIAICQSEHLQRQFEKIAKGYKATIYPCPKTFAQREEMLIMVQQRLDDLEEIIQKSKEQIENKLQVIVTEFYSWHIKLIKMKACYFTLNKFQHEVHGYVAEGYVPVCELQRVQDALTSAYESAGCKGPPVITPIKSTTLPTYYRTNRFTVAFQVIIDSYGVARYKEINPAFFSIISFPFLFSVMFGDAGHGIVMFVFGLTLCIWEKKLKRPASKNEICSIIFGGRYMVLVMGLFSIYSGVIYNDFFSKPFNFFGTKYHVIYDAKTLLSSLNLELDPSDPKVFYGVPYPLGLDPIWELSENKITYTNSFKKKISVIFGVSQMTLGVMLSLLNHLYFKDYVDIFCNFIPMILFLMSIFGYMCGLIFAKWLLVLNSSDPQAIATFYQCSPNILIGFINMFLFKYDDSSSNHCSNHTWFPFQQYVQMGLVGVAVICMIWLLLAKPLVVFSRSRQKYKILPAVHVPECEVIEMTELRSDLTAPLQNQTEAETKDKLDKIRREYLKQFTKPVPEEEHVDVGDVLIHQAIHVIEFCLGCVSHTASYLRLWALSLAHAQLSEVLWEKILKIAFTVDTSYMQFIAMFILVCPFAVLTVVILLIMEGLSAFLHTLRLHWVEFNSKFFYGDGFPFQPLSFENIIRTPDV